MIRHLTQSTEKLILRSLIIASTVLLAVSLWSVQTLIQSYHPTVALPGRQALLSELEWLRSDLLMAEIYRRDSISSGLGTSPALVEADADVLKHLEKLRSLVAPEPQEQKAMEDLRFQILTFGASRSAELHDVKALEQIDDLISKIEMDIQDLVLKRHIAHTQQIESDFNIRYLLIIFVSIIVISLFYLFRHYIKERNISEQEIQKLNEELEAANKMLERLANHDPLTGTLNRRGFEKMLAAELNRMQRNGSNLVGVLVDCDDFKQVNESLGHAVGDIVLQEMAKGLQDGVRPTDHVSRIGGDEFVILLPDTSLPEALIVADRLRLAVSDSSMFVRGKAVRATCSFGVAALSENLASIEELLVLTRLALKRSKTYGKNRVSTGKPDVPSGADEWLQTNFDGVLSGSGLRMFRQPIMDLENEKAIAHEYLCRGPKGPFEMPSDLFRLCEEHNILASVDLACLKLGLQAGLRSDSVRVHLNIFPSTLLDTSTDSLLSLMGSVLASKKICLEISEEQFLGDPKFLFTHLGPLREAGILIALDNCGYGRTSLEGVVMIEPHFVKLDGRCTRGVFKDRSKLRQLKRMAKVIDSTGSELIAEGVEHREDVEMIKEAGIKIAQGFLWGQLVCVDSEIGASVLA